MKRLRVSSRFVIATVSILLSGCVQTPGERDASARVVIADGTAAWPVAEISETQSAPAVAQALASARAYWTAQDPAYAENVRIFATADGAFTRSGVDQRVVLYRMSSVPRCCPRTGLAVLEGDRLVRNVAFAEGAFNVWAVSDLNGDGRDDLVLASEFGMGGQVTRGVSLASFGSKGLLDLGHFTVYETACGAGHEGAMASRVSAVPGAGARIEHFRQETCDARVWQTTGQTDQAPLTPAAESPYVDISPQ